MEDSKKNISSENEINDHPDVPKEIQEMVLER